MIKGFLLTVGVELTFFSEAALMKSWISYTKHYKSINFIKKPCLKKKLVIVCIKDVIFNIKYGFQKLFKSNNIIT